MCTSYPTLPRTGGTSKIDIQSFEIGAGNQDHNSIYFVSMVGQERVGLVSFMVNHQVTHCLPLSLVRRQYALGSWAHFQKNSWAETCNSTRSESPGCLVGVGSCRLIILVSPVKRTFSVLTTLIPILYHRALRTEKHRAGETSIRLVP